MGTRVGLWIDHREAHLLRISGTSEETRQIYSDLEKRPQSAGNSSHQGHFESRLMQADDSREKARTMHLNAYYDAVIASMRDAETILVFGPGEAKDEFAKRLKATDLGKRIETVETADKMTDHQIASKIRDFYSKKPAVLKTP
jgi:DNA-binding MurR/RpiR family transcriptional regulator